MTQIRIEVLYIGGAGRSGSTLISQLIGSLDGYISVGELNSSWENCFLKNRLCGCGQPFRVCAFWQTVLEEAFGGIERVDVQHMLALRQATQRGKALLYLLAPRLRSEEFQAQLREHSAAIEAIYQAVHKVSGCSVIVDASKSARYGVMVAEIPGVQAKMLHLVRDSRAVAHSWTRRKRRTDVTIAEEYMSQYSPLASAKQWNTAQMLSSITARRFTASTLYRYEDFVAEPRRALSDMLQRLGMDVPAASPFLTDHEVRLADDHSLCGNPSRFDRGPIVIRPDSEWTQQMPGKEKSQVTLLTLPWLLKYGYLTSGGTVVGKSRPRVASH